MKILNNALIGFAIVSLFSCTQQEPIQKPNIIFILADDMSYRDLSCYGQQQYRTPHIDSLARQGMRFTHAYSAAPECAPARGCLMTGLHTGHGPIRQNSSACGQDYLRDGDITIAEVLKEAGYATGFAGKWGIGQPGTEGVPYKQGFDYAFGYYDQVRAHTFYPFYLWENDKKIEYPQNHGFDMLRRYTSQDNGFPEDIRNKYDEKGNMVINELKDPYGGVYSDNEIEKAALGFIDKNYNQPFFLYYATQLPHGPVMIDNLGEMTNNPMPQPQREWAAMVQKLDSFIGTLIADLKSNGIYENTIIFFASDNGYSMCGYMGRGNQPDWPDDPVLKNKGPFTGGKFSVLEGGCRIPFFVHWPGKVQAAISDEPVWLPDFFPTAVELAGANFEHKVDGINLLPLLLENKKLTMQPRPLYFSKNREQAVRMGQWKAYKKTPERPTQLYLIEEDTYTDSDLSAIYPQIVVKMDKIMKDAHVPHQWYWNPGETFKEFNEKKQKAIEMGIDLPMIRPNGMEKMPWEKDN